MPLKAMEIIKIASTSASEKSSLKATNEVLMGDNIHHVRAESGALKYPSAINSVMQKQRLTLWILGKVLLSLKRKY